MISEIELVESVTIYVSTKLDGYTSCSEVFIKLTLFVCHKS